MRGHSVSMFKHGMRSIMHTDIMHAHDNFLLDVQDQKRPPAACCTLGIACPCVCALCVHAGVLWEPTAVMMPDRHYKQYVQTGT